MKKMLICILLITLVITGCSLKSDKLSLKGDIQNNIVSAVSTVSGKIILMNKSQGEPVKKGDIIAVIDNTNQKYLVEQLQAVANMNKSKLEELESGIRPQQIEQAKNNVSIAEESLNNVQTSYDYINTQYGNALALYNNNALSKTELDNTKYKLDTAIKQLSSAKYQLEIAKQQLALLQSGSTIQSINAARANYEASVAQLNQAQNTLNNYSIVALNDGIIISKNFNLGDVVNVGSNIADIAITNDLYVLCYIPDEYLDKVQYNQSLNVKTSLGEQVGKVSYIALQDEYVPKDKQSTKDTKSKVTKIKVTISDTSGILKSGMTATVYLPK